MSLSDRLRDVAEKHPKREIFYTKVGYAQQLSGTSSHARFLVKARMLAYPPTPPVDIQRHYTSLLLLHALCSVH